MRGRLRSALLGASILAAPASHAATHIRGYGVDRLDLPTTNAEASAYRYDLDGDGASENQFGGVLAVFAGNFNIAMDAINGEAIDAGEIVNLIELSSRDATFTVDPATLATWYIGKPTLAPPLFDGSDVFEFDPALDGVPRAAGVRQLRFRRSGHRDHACRDGAQHQDRQRAGRPAAARGAPSLHRRTGRSDPGARERLHRCGGHRGDRRSGVGDDVQPDDTGGPRVPRVDAVAPLLRYRPGGRITANGGGGVQESGRLLRGGPGDGSTSSPRTVLAGRSIELTAGHP